MELDWSEGLVRMRKQSLTLNDLGFSLIELMIVVCIGGILSSVALPTYREMMNKSHQVQAKVGLSGFYQANQVFFADYNQYFGDWRNIGFRLEGDLYWHIGFSYGHRLEAPPAPAGYTGPGVGAGQPSRIVNDMIACNTFRSCTRVVEAVTGCTSQAPHIWTNDTFIAFACSNVMLPNGSRQLQYWTINEKKELRNTLVP